MVPPYSDRISRVPPYSISLNVRCRLRGYHPVSPDFPDRSSNAYKALRASPISLAATFGISVDFFSSGYLDVSVPPVRPVNLCIQLTVTAYAVGFPHSEIPDSNGFYYLIWAYRKLIRPSSPLTAKASTVYA